MYKQLKTKWIEALISGEYAQGVGHYVTAGKKYDSFCCLGVLCDIQDAVWDMNGYNNACDIGGETLVGNDPVPNGPDLPDQWRLATMNDRGVSFEKIAKYIELHL